MATMKTPAMHTFSREPDEFDKPTNKQEWDDAVAQEREKWDTVNSPAHYLEHPSGVECIDVVEHLSFCLGNVVKYVWRADSKFDALEDLKKAQWYLDREIERRERDE
jgi:hypothetical protein